MEDEGERVQGARRSPSNFCLTYTPYFTMFIDNRGHAEKEMQNMAKNRVRTIAIVAVALLSAMAVYAQAKGYYGVVQSYGEGSIVIVMAHSTGHWTVDSSTRITGAIAVADWVYADVATSVHVIALRMEERPAGRAGVVKEVRGEVLVVRSGNGQETWNVTPETMLNGIERGQFQPGDAVTAKLYKNHNLAELTLTKRGVTVN
jgi:hypothetical protein